ncbi:hypothetical protein KJ693_09210 [bacterium]|nr:hypothetical protein [bacterium]MBU1615471.1 hypothetical protein [bacterium]
MTGEELFKKNLRLSTEFDMYLMEYPEVAKQIPKDALIVLLPEFDNDLCQRNLEITGTCCKEERQPIVYVRIKEVMPLHSRLIKPEIEVATQSREGIRNVFI